MSQQQTYSILWVAPKFPLPADDGSRQATQTLISNLASLGVTVDLVCFGAAPTEGSTGAKTLGVRSLLSLPFKSDKRSSILARLRSLLSNPLLPLTVEPFNGAAKSNRFQRLLTEGKWDAIVYDGVHCAAHSSRFGLYVKQTDFPVIYRAQNCEAQIWRRKAALEGNPIKRFMLKWQSRLVDRFERSLCEAADGIATVSKIDSTALGYPEKTETVPIGFKSFKSSPIKKEPILLFLGRLDWPPNREGLEWFLDSIWRDLSKKRPELKLIIAGSGDGGYLNRYLNQSSIEYLGRVDSVEYLYEQAMISLVPIFYGSGTRVKIIEAAASGVATLSTAIGMEGIELEPGKEYFYSDTREGWLELLSSITPEQAQICAERARERISLEHEERSCAARFINLVSSVHNRASLRLENLRKS